MFKKSALLMSCSIFLFFVLFHTPSPVHSVLNNPPENIILSPGVDSVTVNWNRVQGASYYIIYWGATRALDETPIEVEDQGQLKPFHIIEGLEPDTAYFVAMSLVSAFSETRVSEIQSVTTLQEDPSPDPPVNLWVSSIDDITESSVGLVWDRVPDSDIDSYRILYGTNPGEYEIAREVDGGRNRATITGFTPGTRYYFNITALARVDEVEETETGESDTEEGDTNLFESEPAGEIIVDTLPDDLPPHTPRRIRGVLVDERQVSIIVDPGNENMVDFAGVIINYGQQPGMPDRAVDTGMSARYVFSNLPLETTWYFSGVAYDQQGNQSEPTSEIAVTIEDLQGYTTHVDGFSGGCFVGSLITERKTGGTSYDVAGFKNKIGVSGGYYLPSESGFEDFYGRDNYPVFLFYERLLHRYVSIDLSAGYMRSSGNLRTVETDTRTGIRSTFTMVPAAASINLRFPIVPHVWGFAGIGPDYWYVRETSDLDTLERTSEWIGGYHGRAGLWLYNMDIAYRRWGLLLETRYAVIDRFGKNDMDLGGWLFLVGGFYNF